MIQQVKKKDDNGFILIGAVITCISLLMKIYFFRDVVWVNIDKSMLNNFSTVFLSIILEGFPFILIGALVSSIIQIFVSEETVSKIIPKHKFIGIFMASLVGLVFPVCECAIVPITRRLIKKGVPLNIAVTFMLSVPIMNVVVLGSTYYAFLGMPYMVIARAVFGILSAIIIGWLIGIIYEGNPLKINGMEKISKTKAVSFKKSNVSHINVKYQTSTCSCGHCHTHNSNNKFLGNIENIISHTSAEFYDIGKYFIIGALLAASMQTFVPKDFILSIGSSNLSSIIVMMILAFVLSICSETDAFIARSFLGQFTSGSILGFLILGPMIDIKNTIMLCGAFKFKFVIRLIFLIVSVCFIMAVIANLIPLEILGSIL